MTGLIEYVDTLNSQQDELRRVVDRLGPMVAGRAWSEQLSDSSERDLRWVPVMVRDDQGHLGLRVAKKWAIIGEGGIPDDVQVVGEGFSPLRPFGGMVQPDLEGFQRLGYVVLTKEEFFTLIAELREGVLAGRVRLPFHP